MRVFIYEAITAGAGCAQGADPAAANGLLAEGLAMLRALTEDFAALDGVEVWGLRDARLADFQLPRKEVVIHSCLEEKSAFQRLANECDWALLIAPELDGMLEERVGWMRETRARLLSPSGEFLKIASSKSRTAERLKEHVGVPPLGGSAEPPEGGTPTVFPLVLKRDDGAGSVGMKLIHNQEELAHLRSSILTSAVSAPLRDAPDWKMGLTQRRKGRGGEVEYRLERFCAGLPASVAVLCGPAGSVPLQPCEQILEAGTFAYLGGRTPLPTELAARVKSLALAAIAAMPPTVGYVGVDLVLGEPADGSQDVVIEINPRLTTSYVGLRQVSRQNLAQAMLDVACGRLVDLSFREERVEFQPDGCRLKM